MIQTHLLVISAWLVAVTSSQSCLSWTDPSKCAVCNLYAGFAVNPAGQCRPAPSSNCVEVNANGSCKTCVTGNPPINGICNIASTSSCLFHKSATQCAVLNVRFLMTLLLSVVMTGSANLVANCAVYSSMQTCIKCAKGYALANNLCMPSAVRCVISSVANKCMVCPDRSFPVISPDTNFWVRMFELFNYGVSAPFKRLVCDRNPDQNCEKPASLTDCAVCLRGFYIGPDKKCARGDPIDFCAHHASQSACQDCDSGYYWDGSICYNPQTYDTLCIAFSSPTACSRCKTGYYLDPTTKQCLEVAQPPIADCDVYQDATTCLYCRQGYLLSNNACQLWVKELCAQTDTNGACTACVEGYKFSDSTCVATAETANCVRFGTDGKCLRCNKFTVRKSDGTCGFVTSPNCTYYSRTGACLVCLFKGLAGDFCVDPVASSTPFTYCLTSINGRCMKYNTALQMVQCDGKDLWNHIQNCVNQNGQNCEACQNGFYPTQFRFCGKGEVVKGCLMVGVRGSCFMCQFYASATDTTCLDPAGRTPLPNCLSQIGDNQCKYCNEGYKVNATSKMCEAADTPANCLVVDPANLSKCLICKERYVRDEATSACLNTSDFPKCSTNTLLGCHSCEPGFELAPDMLSCVPSTSANIANCLSSSKGKCIYCLKDYFPTADGQCVGPVGAIPATMLNCEVMSFSTLIGCSNCREGYGLINGSCSALKLIPNFASILGCRFYSIRSVNGVVTYSCTECLPEFTLSTDTPGNACIKKTVLTMPGPADTGECLHMSKEGNCAEYLPSFSAYAAGLKTMCPADIKYEGCVAINKALACVVCQPQFYLSNGLCVSKLLQSLWNCQIITPSNVCLKCKPGFYLANNTCTATSAVLNCLDYSSKTTCSLCKPNWTLSLSKTTCLASCEAPGQTVCSLCLPNFYLDYSNECVPAADPSAVPNCRYFASDTTCLMCEQGFALTINGSCQAADGYGPCKSLVQSVNECEVCTAGQAPGARRRRQVRARRRQHSRLLDVQPGRPYPLRRLPNRALPISYQ